MRENHDPERRLGAICTNFRIAYSGVPSDDEQANYMARMGSAMIAAHFR